jgi:hypothetical protein
MERDEFQAVVLEMLKVQGEEMMEIRTSIGKLEKKLDALLNTMGIRESFSRETQHRLNVIASMTNEERVAYMRDLRRKADRR